MIQVYTKGIRRKKLQELIGYISNTDLDTILDNVIFITDLRSRCLYSLAIFI
jgi:hypothetical protein